MRYIMRKICLIPVMIAVIVFTGCGQKKNEDPVTVTLWHVYGGQTESPLNDLIDEFNETLGKEENIRVQVGSVTNTNTIHENVLASAFGDPGASKLPDMFVSYPKTVLAMPDDTEPVDYYGYFTEEELNEFIPAFLEEGIIHERLSILPVAKSTEVMFINKTAFDRFAKETGAKMEDLKTWEGLFAMAEQYAAWTDNQTPDEYEKIVALEEKIEEARTMLKNDTLKGNAEEKVEEVVNATFEQVEAELKEAQESVEDALRLVPEGTIKEIIKAKDHEAYKVMLDGFNETLDRLRKYAGNTGAFKTMESKFAEAKVKVDAFLDKHGKTEKVLSILGQLIRKIAAVILGLAKFAVDTVAILATMVLRVSVAVAEEVVDSSKAIGSSFNKNIFGLFRKNK